MVTPRGAKYVLVMVEHFSKWIELVALLQNSSELAAAAFLDQMLARFGAPAEVLTDQRSEFLGAFEVLCTKALIDHVPPLEIIRRQTVWRNVWFRRSSVDYGSMDYFTVAIVTGI